MKTHLSDLWRWDGTIHRGPYALIGVIGFLIKHNLDRFVATLVFHRPWGLFNYWISPVAALQPSTLSRSDSEWLAAMLVMSLPFIWVGIMLTVRRLRAVGLPIGLAVLFFAPVLNLAFFTILSVLPSQPTNEMRASTTGILTENIFNRMIPRSRLGSAAMAILVTALMGTAFTVLGTHFLSRYGWGLFVALPFCLGLVSALIYGFHEKRSLGGCLLVATIAISLLAGSLVLFAIEGIACLIMAAPIGLVLAFMGALFGYLIQRRPWNREQAPAALLALICFAPLLMGAEAVAPIPPPLLEVKSSIDIDAPPETVWHRVVAFSELPPPTETIFRIGIAYPTQAIIAGQGPGAVRHCEFSTGAFVEPVQIWDEPHLLKFSVVAQPAPMQEWTPYREIHPKHLSGYLVSERGQFLLTQLPSGGTHLEGTTWYRHNLWPADYWQLWSDTVIHRIHLRVLRHIKKLAEQDAAAVR